MTHPKLTLTDAGTDGFVPVSKLDRKKFDRTISLIALRIDARHCSAFMHKYSGLSFKLPKMKCVYSDSEDPCKRLLLLNPSITDLSLSCLSPELLAYNQEHGAETRTFPLMLGYDSLTVDEVLSALLPLDEVPSSYEQIGHIAHMNLRDDALPYKYIIGQVVLDKNSHTLKLVVNKQGNIETEFRTFPMEVIAHSADVDVSREKSTTSTTATAATKSGSKNSGVSIYDVTVRESGAIFRFNFRDVYWNSRLSTEHGRLVNIIAKHHMACSSNAITGAASPVGHHGQVVVADMMAGVGPFAVPLAMNAYHYEHISATTTEPQSISSTPTSSNAAAHVKGVSRLPQGSPRPPRVTVHANDLNPRSYEYLVQNARLNHVHSNDSLYCYNLDGREFIYDLARRNIGINHAILNLPGSATDFLDAFIGLKHRYSDPACFRLPRIHVYAFSTSPDPAYDIAVRACATMRCSVSLLGARAAATTTAAAEGVTATAGDTGEVTVTAEDTGEVTVVPGFDRAGDDVLTFIQPKRKAGMPPTTTTTTTTARGGSIPNAAAATAADTWGHIVRDVAPHKVMVCLSFNLPREVAEAELVPASLADPAGSTAASTAADVALALASTTDTPVSVSASPREIVVGDQPDAKRLKK